MSLFNRRKQNKKYVEIVYENIELLPLEKMICDGKEVLLDSTIEEVIKVLGEPESIYKEDGKNGWRYYYSEFCCSFDKDKKLECIEFLNGHIGKLRPYIYGVSVFDVKRKELLDVLKKHDDEIDEFNEDSYSFKNISVGVWKYSGYEDDDYWTTILIGRKDYYNY